MFQTDRSCSSARQSRLPLLHPSMVTPLVRTEECVARIHGDGPERERERERNGDSQFVRVFDCWRVHHQVWTMLETPLTSNGAQLTEADALTDSLNTGQYDADASFSCPFKLKSLASGMIRLNQCKQRCWRCCCSACRLVQWC